MLKIAVVLLTSFIVLSITFFIVDFIIDQIKQHKNKNDKFSQEFLEKCRLLGFNISFGKEIHIGEELYDDMKKECYENNDNFNFGEELKQIIFFDTNGIIVYDFPVFKNKNLPKRDVHVFEQLNHGYEKWPDTNLTFEQYTQKYIGRITGSKFGI